MTAAPAIIENVADVSHSCASLLWEGVAKFGVAVGCLAAAEACWWLLVVAFARRWEEGNAPPGIRLDSRDRPRAD